MNRLRNKFRDFAIWLCLKLVYPKTQLLIITFPTNWPFGWYIHEYIRIYIYIHISHVHPFADPILIPLSWLKSHHVAWSPKWGQKLCRLGPASQFQKQLRQNVEILQVGFPHCLGLKGIRSLCLSGKIPSWGVPKSWGTPKSSIYRWIFHHRKPSSYWGYPHLWKHPYVTTINHYQPLLNTINH